ncbi:MAG: phosphoenolpyruvate carboxykinase (ATP) [Saprospiraceae bacterium]
MPEIQGRKNPSADLSKIGLDKVKQFWNLSPAALIEKTLVLGQGELASSGALKINTGKFTGRSPKDRYIVKDGITKETVNWGKINTPFDPKYFEVLRKEITTYLNAKDHVYVRDVYACTNLDYRLDIRVVTEFPWQNLFVRNMFLRIGNKKNLESFTPDWTILAAPGYYATPKIHGTTAENFAIINFTKKCIIIGGTAYTGEIKKGIFSVLNFKLPYEKNVLSMHCSANVGKKGDTSLFFGLSGTGKTTLSTDAERKLIGDDEHGWSTGSVFNFEGGCYAKTIDLSESKEPQIFKAIKFGALLENVNFTDDNNHVVDYTDDSITQNTRVSYPIDHIENIVYNSRGDIPENIFFLTCDAFGVLPPISRLNNAQAMYHFLSGYTAKIAGTEAGIVEPEATFSACFGAPFLPLIPTFYADLLGEKISLGSKKNSPIKVWLVNTGWSGGSYGDGNRMPLSFTRGMIKAALDRRLEDVEYHIEPVFGLKIPKTCPDVPNSILTPRDTWKNEEMYDVKAKMLVKLFVANFEQYKVTASKEVIAAGPKE